MVSFGDLWGGFTGDSQKKYTNEAYQNSTRELQQGRDQSIGALDAGYGDAKGYLNPYNNQGQTANNLYGTFLGLNGADAQRGALAGYSTSDPFRHHNEDQVTRAMSRRYNAMGMGNSGNMAYAMSRASLDRGSQDYENYMNRLQGQGQQGYGAANTLGQYAMQNGQGQAGIYTGYGQNQAGQEIQRGNALSQASGIFGNNLMKVGGMIISAVTGMPVGMGSPGGDQPTKGGYGVNGV